MSNDYLIYGGGRLGRQMHDLLKAHQADGRRCLGFIDDIQAPGTPVIESLHTLGGLEAVSAHAEYGPGDIDVALGIGYDDMAGRGVAFQRLKEAGYTALSFVHPRAVVEFGAVIGEGCVILAGAIVDQNVKLGPANYLDIGVKIGEYCVIGDNNYFAAGASVGGSVTIGRDNFVGLDATLVNDISIGNGNFINAKTLVYKNVEDRCKVIEMHQFRTMKL